MGPVERGRWREHAVLAAGLGAALALGWAGVVLHGSAGAAGEAALARLAGEVSDTVVAEWGRMRRGSEAPVQAAGETFRWIVGQRRVRALWSRTLEDLVLEEPTLEEASVFWTLLDEAERRELVGQDLDGALELVLEALEKDPEEEDREQGWLRALQLAARLGREDVVRAQWERLRTTELAEMCDGFPCRLLGWLALPEAFRDATPIASVVSATDLESFALHEDRLTLGPPEEPAAEFDVAPILVVLCERLGLELPPLERRKTAALERLGGRPDVLDDGLWHFEMLVGRPFVAREVGGEVTGSFYLPRELEAALAERSGLPAGFHLDFDGDFDDLGAAVRQSTPLPGSELAFVLRHDDPQRIVRGEAARLGLQRAGLFALALACAAGGVLTARLLRRERALAALRTSFIAGVSHDLRTPLASILLLAENLEAGRIGEEQRGRYHIALRREAERLRRLIDDVLDFPRLERGEETHLEREEVDLPRFLGELAQDLGQRVLDARREFALEQGPVPGTAHLDAHAVRRAVSNLVDNALKHGEGEVRLAWSAEGERLLLTVADQGPGVPARHARAIFEPFRSFARGNGAAGGTGLGLAIVRSIARAHGGEVRLVENVPGAGGAAFELELALEETSA